MSLQIWFALLSTQADWSKIVGIVGRDGGYTARVADAAIIVPVVNSENTTPHSEAFQAVIWHLFVSHPLLKVSQTKWEGNKVGLKNEEANDGIHSGV